MGDADHRPTDDDAGLAGRLTGLSDRQLLLVGVLALGGLGALANLVAIPVLWLAPMYVAVLLAGLLGGPVAGLATGALAMGLFQLALGLPDGGLAGGVDIHALAPTLAMAEVGGLAGFLARLRFRERAVARPLPWLAVAAALGFVLVLVFSVVADVTEWLLVVAGVVPAAHVPYVGGMVASGVAFNLPVALVNAPLFAASALAAALGLERLREAPGTRDVVGPLVARVDALGWERTARA